MKNYISFIEELNENSLLEAGGKGANLGVLVNAGLPVPPGFCVLAGAYRTHLEASSLVNRIADRLKGVEEHDITEISAASHDISAWIEDAAIPAEIEKAITSAYKKLIQSLNVPVAVRSSATAEDLPTASFAGQQETYLGIKGEASIVFHVKKCWASLWTPQAISYRISMGFEHLKVDLAVVVQSMVSAEAAGVMFTANPVNDSKDEILISASYGLGEAVVSGLVTPDTFVLSKNGSIKQQTLGSKELRITMSENGTCTEEVETAQRNRFCLNNNHLLKLLELAKRIEDHYGKPQDTEWALAGGNIYMLQARPITTANDEYDSVLESGDEILWKGKKPPFGINDLMEHFVEPMPPMDVDLYCAGDRAFQRMFEHLGMPMPKEPTSAFERPSGCIAVRMQQSRLSPAILWKLPTNLISKSRINPLDSWKPLEAEMKSWLKKMKAEENETDDPTSLARFISKVIGEFEEFAYRRFVVVFTASMLSDIRVGSYVKKAVGKEAAADIKPKLYKALDFRTAMQNRALGRLAQTAAAHGKESLQFKAAFDEFIEEYGDRPALGMIPFFSIPTWSEKPETIISLVDSHLADPETLNWEKASKQQEREYTETRKLVEGALSPKARKKFSDYLEKTRNGIIVREESLFLIEKVTAFIRHAALKLGDMLCKKGVLDSKEDVFFLFTAEMQKASEGAAELHERVEKRKKAFAKVYAAHEKGKHWMVTTGSLAPLETYKSNKKEKMGSSEDASGLKGLAASRGEFEGTVCIVRGPHEFGKLKKGEILVAPFTAPIWTPLFRVASAVVTEIGSPVSHAAIVAREYGIPAVVAVDNATTLLKDGQRVRVDGVKGLVTILK